MLDKLDNVIRAIEKTLLVLACVFLALMMFHVALDVFARFLFNRPLTGTLETVSFYYMVFAVFLPLAFVERSGEHIRVDLFTQMMPHALQLLLYIFACILGLIFFGMLTYQSYLDAMRATMRQETIMSNFLFYIWPARWALPIGFGFVSLAILTNMLKAIARRRAL